MNKVSAPLKPAHNQTPFPMQRGIDAYNPKPCASRHAKYYTCRKKSSGWVMLRQLRETGVKTLYRWVRVSSIMSAELLHEAKLMLQRASFYRYHRLTTRESSFRNCRRYLAISRAMPLGSLIFFWRSSFSTLRRPSFHCCFSSGVLPGLAVPS
jgi:hypothetical protein